MSDFIDELRKIRGSNGSDLPSVDELTEYNTGGGGTITEWGIRGEVKLTASVIAADKVEITTLKNEVVVMDSEIETKYIDIIVKSGEVTTAYTDIVGPDGTTGKYAEIVAMDEFVTTSFDLIAGTTGDGLTDGLHKNVVDKSANVDIKEANTVGMYNDITAATTNNGNITDGYYGDVVVKHTDTTTKYDEVVAKHTELTVTDTNGSAGIYGDITAKHTEVVAAVSTIEPKLDEIEDVSFDLQGKDLTGTDYVGITGSRILATGENLGKGINSEVLAVGEDLISDASKIGILTEAAYKAAVETVGDATYRDEVAIVAEGGYKEDVQIVAGYPYRDTVTDVADMAPFIIPVGEDIVKVGEDPDDEATYSHIKHAVTNAQLVTDAGTLANEWAENPENVEITGEVGSYSALHHSAKSEGHATIAENNKISAAGYAGSSSDSAVLSAEFRDESQAYRDELTGLTATANNLVEGSNASTSYDSGTGVLTVGIPVGATGAKGDPFLVNEQGTLAGRDSYDGEVEGFSYLDTDSGNIYFKLTSADADWSDPISFGKGDTGDTGIGISSIVFHATTDGSGNAAVIGATDTYRITFTDNTTFDYDIVNGNAYTDAMAVTAIESAATITITNANIDSVTNKVGADHIHLKVKATEDLVKGQVVKATGYNSGEDAIEVEKTNIQTDVALGVVLVDMAAGTFGPIMNTGMIEGLDTDVFGFGTILYSDAGGAFTDIKPTGVYQTVGFVTKNHATNGAIWVEMTDSKDNLADEKAKLELMTVTQTVDLDTMESDTATNNAKITNVTTDLSVTATETVVTVESSDGTNAEIVAASTTTAGVMTKADYDKLDGIATNATVDQDLSGLATKTQDSATGTTYADTTNGLSYKLYSENGKIIMEEL